VAKYTGKSILASARSFKTAQERQPLTERQELTYNLVVKAFRENGRCPSYRELGVQLGGLCLNAVRIKLLALVRKGWLEVDPTASRLGARRYRPKTTPGHCVTCGKLL
jgi:hypothetical protein